MEFRTATMDKATKAITVVVGLVALANLIAAIQFQNQAFWVISLILIAILLISYLFIPKIYFEQRNLFISNTFRTVKIPVESIQSVSELERGKLYTRTFGIGGLFGNFGYFNGKEFWLVTNSNKKVKIVTDTKTYVVSPEETKKFIGHIHHLQNSINL